MSRHIIADRKTEIILGIAAFLGGALLLRDAYDNRGRPVPPWARPFTFW